MREDYILLILNCKKYIHKSDIQKRLWVNKLDNIKHFYIRGDENISVDFKFDKNILYVRCKDDYVSLPTKMILAIEAIKNTFEYKYIFKTDDDQMLVNKNFFSELIHELEEEKYDYGGFIVDIKNHYSSYKKENIQMDSARTSNVQELILKMDIDKNKRKYSSDTFDNLV